MGTAVNHRCSHHEVFCRLSPCSGNSLSHPHSKKYEHYKPGYMRIPGWEKIASGERKLNQKAPTMKFTPRDEIDTRETCGTPGPKSDIEKIVGGQEATPHQFPWQVGLFFDGYFCGGSIISSKYILTAAHCADGVFHHEVVIGAHEIRDPSNKIIDAYSPTVHPEWDSYNLANDIAILELEEEIDFATEPNVGPNCLASDGDHTGEMALVSGWGRPSDSSSGISEVLRYVDDRRVLSQSECENYWGNLNDGVVCIDTTDGGGSCNGDSGGPLSIPGAQYEQIGIVSFGSTLGCESGAPAGFTEVTMYRDWISSVTGIKV